MPLCKRAPGSGFQVAFESKSGSFVAEFNGDDDPPRTVPHGLAVGPAVVPFKPLLYVGREADVVAIRVGLAAKDIDEAFAEATHIAETSSNQPTRIPE